MKSFFTPGCSPLRRISYSNSRYGAERNGLTQLTSAKNFSVAVVEFLPSPVFSLQGVKLTTEQFNAIFAFYDKVGDISFKGAIKKQQPNTKGVIIS